MAIGIFGVGGEAVARYGLGLGTPPLFIADSELEYQLKPNQDLFRFGNRFVVNQLGMRSEPFPQNKPDPSELRVMVFGDSVINGGTATSHEQLATEILRKRLAAVTGRKVVVGNISAGSWGPGNYLAYANRHGFFDADFIAVVLSTHDADDIRRFKGLDAVSQPTETPFSALWEGVTRYGWPRLHHFGTSALRTRPTTTASTTTPKGTALPNLMELIRLAGDRTVTVFHFPTYAEAEHGFDPTGVKLIRHATESSGGAYIPLSSVDPIDDTWKSLYRDALHPNVAGQVWLAERLLQSILLGANEGRDEALSVHIRGTILNNGREAIPRAGAR